MIVRGMSNADYHACPEMSRSRLELMGRTPAYYKAFMDGVIERKQTAALTLGTRFHCAVLEPSQWAERYALLPEFENSAQSKAGKLEREAWATENPGEPVTSDEYKTIWDMAAALKAHPMGSLLLQQAGPTDREVSVFGTLADVPCRCRPDAIVPVDDGVFLVDLKSTGDASPTGFAKSVANYGYDIQDAFYSDLCTEQGMNVLGFVFIATESAPPYLTATYCLKEVDIETGRERYRDLLALYARCVELNEWPGLSGAIEVLELPKWHTYRRAHRE